LRYPLTFPLLGVKKRNGENEYKGMIGKNDKRIPCLLLIRYGIGWSGESSHLRHRYLSWPCGVHSIDQS